MQGTPIVAEGSWHAKLVQKVPTSGVYQRTFIVFSSSLPSERDLEDVRRAEKMAWKGLNTLWTQIKAGNTPGWDGGKALEYLVIRAFKLSKLEAEYPYDVPPGGTAIEQIAGLVHLDCHTFLTECKDKETVDIEAIAKLRNQLLRRPDTTFGSVFAADRFTAPALILADYSVPHRILL